MKPVLKGYLKSQLAQDRRANRRSQELEREHRAFIRCQKSLVNKILAIALTLLLMATGAQSQSLGSPQIRRELGLSHEISVLILRDLNEAARLNQGGAMTLEQNRALQAERKNSPSPQELSRRAMNRLTPAQKKRLEQIELQSGDPFVLQDWRVAQRVGMTSARYNELSRIITKASGRRVKAEEALFERDLSWWMKADRKKYAARYAAHEREFNRIGQRYRATVQNAVNRILTAQQKAKWKQIKGKPFKAKLTSDIKVYALD